QRRREFEEQQAFRKSPGSSAIVRRMVDDAYKRGVKDGAETARAATGAKPAPDPDAELTRAKSELARAYKLVKEMTASLSWAQARHRSPEAAMLADIEAAHRELVKKHHPDRGGDPGIMIGLNLLHEAVEAAITRVR